MNAALRIPDGTEFWWDRFLVGQSVAKRLNNASGQRLCLSTLLSLSSPKLRLPMAILSLSRTCKHVTKLVPKLEPIEECVDVPKEVCTRWRTNPRKVKRPAVKKWCYVPSEESGLA